MNTMQRTSDFEDWKLSLRVGLELEMTCIETENAENAAAYRIINEYFKKEKDGSISGYGACTCEYDDATRGRYEPAEFVEIWQKDEPRIQYYFRGYNTQRIKSCLQSILSLTNLESKCNPGRVFPFLRCRTHIHMSHDNILDRDSFAIYFHNQMAKLRLTDKMPQYLNGTRYARPSVEYAWYDTYANGASMRKVTEYLTSRNSSPTQTRIQDSSKFHCEFRNLRGIQDLATNFARNEKEETIRTVDTFVNLFALNFYKIQTKWEIKFESVLQLDDENPRFRRAFKNYEYNIFHGRQADSNIKTLFKNHAYESLYHYISSGCIEAQRTIGAETIIDLLVENFLDFMDRNGPNISRLSRYPFPVRRKNTFQYKGKVYKIKSSVRRNGVYVAFPYMKQRGQIIQQLSKCILLVIEKAGYDNLVPMTDAITSKMNYTDEGKTTREYFSGSGFNELIDHFLESLPRLNRRMKRQRIRLSDITSEFTRLRF